MTNPVPSRILSDTVTIASAASLSGAINLGGRAPVGILMPAAWTAASLTFQASLDGVTFGNVYAPDPTGVQAEVEHATDVDRWVTLFPDQFAGARYLKVRSGTAGTPANQGAERILTVVLREFW